MSIKFLITYTAKETSMKMRKGMPHGGPHKEDDKKKGMKMKSKGYARGGVVNPSYGDTFETAMPKAGPN